MMQTSRISTLFRKWCVAMMLLGWGAMIAPVAADATQPASTVKVRIAVNHAPPYRNLHTTPPSGFYIELFNAVMRRLGWEPQYIDVPFRRALFMMERGDADVMLGPVQTPERRAYMDYVVAAFPPERRLFLFRDPQHQIFQYADLKGRTIGTLRGASYFEPFDSDLDLLKEMSSDYENALRMLERGYVDVVIIPELQSIELQNQLGLKMPASRFFAPGEPAWITMSRNSPLIHRREELARAVEEFFYEPEYETLFLQYLARQPGPDDYPFKLHPPATPATAP